MSYHRSFRCINPHISLMILLLLAMLRVVGLLEYCYKGNNSFFMFNLQVYDRLKLFFLTERLTPT